MIKRAKGTEFDINVEEVTSKYQVRDKAKEDAEVRKYARRGLVFLIVGFSLQLLGNWIQYFTMFP